MKAALVLLLCLLFPLAGQRREQESRGAPGVFDHFVLALSWSPEYCASPAGRNDRTQCGGRRYAFVVHGLWPQYKKGWPQYCAADGRLSPLLVNGMLDIMPSRRLIEHEWWKHGTCAGPSSAEYFRMVRQAYSTIRIPPAFQNLSEYLSIEPAELERLILRENPAIKPEGLTLLCRGRFLQEIRICLDRNLQPRPCGAGVPDGCLLEKAVLRPLR